MAESVVLIAPEEWNKRKMRRTDFVKQLEPLMPSILPQFVIVKTDDAEIFEREREVIVDVAEALTVAFHS